MGLSDEERYAKIVHSVNHITNIAEDLPQGKLKTLAARLWYDFLHNDSNGMFWFLGSDLANDYMAAMSLAGVAFKQHVPRKNELEDMSQKLREEDRFYDSYRTLSDFCTMERLLAKEESAVLKIYQHVQHIAYAMCRYRDEFMDSLDKLNMALRTMQGECFNLMQASKSYSHAWMLHNLTEKIFTSTEEDLVNQWWVKDCIPHHVKVEWDEYDGIYEAYRKHQFRDLTLQDRIDLTLLMVNNRYGTFDHQNKSLLELFHKYNKDKKNKVKLKIKALEEYFTKSKAAKEEEKNRVWQRDCELTDNYIDHKGEVHNPHDYRNTIKLREQS